MAAMAMTGHDPAVGTAANYRAFAQLEARGRSPQYEALAAAVADDRAIITFLKSLPPHKQQPNLLFAGACYLLGSPAETGSLRKLVAERGPELRAVMLARRTQTNEAARCATLLPALAELPQPLALLEVGASAGLTLLPDRYSYDYAGHRITGTDPLAPLLRCEPRGPVPLPARVPDVRWRAGLDLNPLDVRNADDVRWLECLLWPGDADRAGRLADAIAVARRDPPLVRRGDLRTDLPALASEAPQDATLVIYHSAVLAYVSEAQRRQFAGIVRALSAVWLSNEGPRVLAGIGVLPGASASASRSAFLLARDGRALAFADPHGTWLDWAA